MAIRRSYLDYLLSLLIVDFMSNSTAEQRELFINTFTTLQCREAGIENAIKAYARNQQSTEFIITTLCDFMKENGIMAPS